MFEQIIIDQNPHWNEKKKIELIERDVFLKYEKFLEINQILTITGIRRSGKSYLLKQIINYLLFEKNINPKNIFFLNLENTFFTKYKEDVTYLEKIYEDYLKLANPKGKIYIFFDEVQFFKNWQVFIKSKYEEGKIKFILTGSNAWMLSSEFSTLLSGRNIEITNFPFSLKEILNYNSIKYNTKIEIIQNRIRIKQIIDEILKIGSFPEIIQLKDKSNYKEILQSYIKNILYQDIVPRFEIKKIAVMEKLFEYLISNFSNPYSYNNLSKIFEINDKTIKEYIKYFQESYLFYEIEKFDYSLKKQKANEKKIYVADIGFINSIAFKFSEDKGKLIENLVFLELIRRKKKVYYHKENKECDFVILENNKITKAIQVSLNLTNEKTKLREIRGLVDACKCYNLRTGTILTEDYEDEFIEENIKISIKPIWKWLLE